MGATGIQPGGQHSASAWTGGEYCIGGGARGENMLTGGEGPYRRGGEPGREANRKGGEAGGGTKKIGRRRGVMGRGIG